VLRGSNGGDQPVASAGSDTRAAGAFAQAVVDDVLQGDEQAQGDEGAGGQQGQEEAAVLSNTTRLKPRAASPNMRWASASRVPWPTSSRMRAQGHQHAGEAQAHGQSVDEGLRHRLLGGEGLGAADDGAVGDDQRDEDAEDQVQLVEEAFIASSMAVTTEAMMSTNTGMRISGRTQWRISETVTLEATRVSVVASPGPGR
jgi:hypothetical protein